MTDTPTAPKRTARTPEEKKEHFKFLAEQIELDRPTGEVVAGYVRRFGRSKRQCYRDIKASRRRLLMRVLRRAGGRPLAVVMAERHAVARMCKGRRPVQAAKYLLPD